MTHYSPFHGLKIGYQDPGVHKKYPHVAEIAHRYAPKGAGIYDTHVDTRRLMRLMADAAILITQDQATHTQDQLGLFQDQGAILTTNIPHLFKEYVEKNPELNVYLDAFRNKLKNEDVNFRTPFSSMTIDALGQSRFFKLNKGDILSPKDLAQRIKTLGEERLQEQPLTKHRMLIALGDYFDHKLDVHHDKLQRAAAWSKQRPSSS